MFNLSVVIISSGTLLLIQTSFWMEVICSQNLLIEYLEKYSFLKIADLNSIFVNVKVIIQLSRQHFFGGVK